VYPTLLQDQLRSGLMLYDASFWPLLTRPVSLAFIIIAVLTMLWPFLTKSKKEK